MNKRKAWLKRMNNQKYIKDLEKHFKKELHRKMENIHENIQCIKHMDSKTFAIFSKALIASIKQIKGGNNE